MDETTDLVADGPGLPGLRDAVAHALGVTAPELGAVRVRPVDHRVDNLTTASLHHVEVDVGETTVRLFAKVLQPADRSPARPRERRG